MKLTEELIRQMTGAATNRRTIRYTQRDMALYALSVGAGPEELLYTFEKGMKALPTFGVLPQWAAMQVEPPMEYPCPAAFLLLPHLDATVAPLHMEQTLLLHRPIPVSGALVYQDVITGIYDRGAGKGAVVRSRLDVRDEAGELLCTNYSSTLFQESGGFGGEPLPKSEVTIPARAPDFTAGDRISPVQNALYRLTGDTNLVHIDPAYARAHGFDRVFMQGLCSFGFAGRMAISCLIPGAPERVTQVGAQMRSVLYPDTQILLHLWVDSPGRAVFRLLDAQSGAVILDKGSFFWK